MVMECESRLESGAAALVTGAAVRLGRAAALGLAAHGVNVVIHYRGSRREAEETARECRALGVRAVCLSADLAADGEAARLVTRACEAAGPLTYLVNNASIFPRTTLADMTAEDLLANMRVNAVAPFEIARAFAAQAAAGAIVNMLDTRILHNDRLHTAYHVSKRALFTLTRMMALEFAPAVRVNAVAPGLILPPPGEDETFLEKHASENPLARHGAPGDVVAAIVFLLASAFVTGQVLYVDGGFHMKGCVYGA